jgi:hypothetical protein
LLYDINVWAELARLVVNRHREERRETPKYVIEREIPCGKFDRSRFRRFRKIRGVLKNLGRQFQWLESYVTQDQTASISLPMKWMVRKHAKRGLSREPVFRN